jgi:hypothetical protein
MQKSKADEKKGQRTGRKERQLSKSLEKKVIPQKRVFEIESKEKEQSKLGPNESLNTS